MCYLLLLRCSAVANPDELSLLCYITVSSPRSPDALTPADVLVKERYENEVLAFLPKSSSPAASRNVQDYLWLASVIDGSLVLSPAEQQDLAARAGRVVSELHRELSVRQEATLLAVAGPSAAGTVATAADAVSNYLPATAVAAAVTAASAAAGSPPSLALGAAAAAFLSTVFTLNGSHEVNSSRSASLQASLARLIGSFTLPPLEMAKDKTRRLSGRSPLRPARHVSDF